MSRPAEVKPAADRLAIVNTTSLTAWGICNWLEPGRAQQYLSRGLPGELAI